MMNVIKRRDREIYIMQGMRITIASTKEHSSQTPCCELLPQQCHSNHSAVQRCMGEFMVFHFSKASVPNWAELIHLKQAFLNF